MCDAVAFAVLLRYVAFGALKLYAAICGTVLDPDESGVPVVRLAAFGLVVCCGQEHSQTVCYFCNQHCDDTK